MTSGLSGYCFSEAGMFCRKDGKQQSLQLKKGYAIKQVMIGKLDQFSFQLLEPKAAQRFLYFNIVQIKLKFCFLVAFVLFKTLLLG